MASRASRRLVIDASVARAAGPEESAHPTGARCREFLEAVRTICHRLVMTADLAEEWKEHQSSFARKWRVRMAARKKTDSVETGADEKLRNRACGAASTEKQREAMRKDWLLVEAALAADQRIVALDETVRALFADAARHVAPLKGIVWVNPDRPDEDPVGWLKSGAKAESRRKLGH